jgi:oligopeptidase B
MNGEIKCKYYDYMLSYSPYDNVKKQIILICTFRLDFMIHKYNIGSQQNGLLNWEQNKINDTVLYLNTNMDAGRPVQTDPLKTA